MSSQNKQVCAQVLKVPEDNRWAVIDSVGDLALCHFKYSSDEKPSTIRGVIVDTKAKCVVTPSPGIHQIYVSDTVKINEDGEYLLDHNFTFPAETKILPGKDGVIVRAFKHAGKIYLSSFKNIDLQESKAQLYDTPSFWDMYHQSGGPALNKLFHPEKKYSAYVYTFLVSHSDVLTVSKIPIEKGHKVYLLYHTCLFDKSKCPYDESDVDWELSQFDFNTLKTMDLDNANQFLKTGYYPGNYDQIPYQIHPGEYLAMYERISNSKAPKITMVHSRAYNNRYLIKKSRTNLRMRFFQLTNYARNTNKKGRQEYLEYFPLLEDPPLDQDKIITLNNELNRSLRTYIDRVANIWINFMLAVPLCKQNQVAKLFVDYVQTQKRVALKMKELYSKGLNGYGYKHKRIKIILENTRRKYRNQRVRKAELKRYFSSIIKRETGTSLYLIDKELSETPDNKSPQVPVGGILKTKK